MISAIGDNQAHALPRPPLTCALKKNKMFCIELNTEHLQETRALWNQSGKKRERKRRRVYWI